MTIKEQLRDARQKFKLLSFYQQFERVVILILTAFIAIIVIAALWSLSLKILFGLVLSGSLDPSDYAVFQAVFGMIFTVIIALEFKKSLLVVAERHDSVVQIRSVVMIALLAICRKIIILDLTETDAWHILAFATAIIALGIVYWLIRDSDQPLGDRARDQPINSPFHVNR
ncbi:phosphate-starvation-inducible PsiE family protein [Bradyrhizobium genosp. P]|uniref:phosphate-starvation-inducible PsiE family protein n=1 Tax=Bradyrhizobium genosp. P TaxID=83641 RepID=UPI003CF4EC94